MKNILKEGPIHKLKQNNENQTITELHITSMLTQEDIKYVELKKKK